MAEHDKNPPPDDHIEDLLSQLQGIFGKLSRQEEDDAKGKVELPKPPAAPRPSSPPPMPKTPEPTPLAGPYDLKPPMPETPMAKEPPARVPDPLPSPPPPVVPPPVAAPPAAPPPAAEPPPAPPPAPTLEDPSQVATHIAFPIGRDAEAKSLAQKLETITPKFTKVAFRLKVTHVMAYDPKTEWKDSVLQSVMAGKARTLFLVMDRPLDETRRKAMAVEMEKSGVYFQEAPLLSIEKKAFYTDVLLGLVFFMDSQKSGESGQAA